MPLFTVTPSYPAVTYVTPGSHVSIFNPALSAISLRLFRSPDGGASWVFDRTLNVGASASWTVPAEGSNALKFEVLSGTVSFISDSYSASPGFDSGFKPLVRRDRQTRIWNIGDSIAGDSGESVVNVTKRCLMAAGYAVNMLGTENPESGMLYNENRRDDEYDSLGGQTIDQIAAAVPGLYATLVAAQGEPDIVNFIGGYNHATNTAAAIRTSYNALFDAIYATGFGGKIFVTGTFLQSGVIDSTQLERFRGLDMALRDEWSKGRPTYMSVGYEWTAWPRDDRVTTDNTHPSRQGAVLLGIAAAAGLCGMSPVEMENLVGGLVGVIWGRGGKLALMCMAGVGGTSNVTIATYDREGRMGGRGVAAANTLGTFRLAFDTTGKTLVKALSDAGVFEDNMVRAKVLKVEDAPCYFWAGAGLNGTTIEIPISNTHKPERLATGNYDLITATARPPEIWLG